MPETTTCIEWTGGKAGNGYGVTSRDGRQVYVHRVAYMERYGPIPDGHVVAHKCDNPACYNPDHLFACTQAENLADMRAKGRAATGARHGTKTRPERTARGERVASAKLTAKQVMAIRAEYAAPDVSLAGIAKRYGIAFQTVHKIVKRHAWKHL